MTSASPAADARPAGRTLSCARNNRRKSFYDKHLQRLLPGLRLVFLLPIR
ncbi:hypothetical protein K788_0003719 [Paraburkholderia caribensis MBA4]|uniref:Uncharacterized protein n=1 Tax=Paraburkholderia caribensis MBA4 TaxID=1323664 RepID=A0A0P0RBW9_9BURK|nr:hypothetical protein K788_0003719 [Paraburkholderia caribensis MBA4]